MKAKILVVEDEAHMGEILRMLLQAEGHQVQYARDGQEALKWLQKEIFHLVITDIRMPGVDGFEVLRRTKALSPETLVIMITAYGSTEGAIEAMKLGAYDYIHKPFKIDELRLVVKKALERHLLRRQVEALRQRTGLELEGIVARSPQMQRLLQMLPRIAHSSAHVLITGESGTGKELIASALHRLSGRAGEMVALNCAALPAGLLESELFGFMRGAFTGAVKNKPGLFEVADGGSLFLDEVAELPLELQGKLLRVIETGTFRRLGGTTDITVDVRIIAATNRDLKEAVAQGAFREDLFWRLNGVPLHIPPLRERPEDIPALIEHFLKRRSEHRRLSPGALRRLMGHPWRGNVRELENTLERILLFSDNQVLTEEDIPEDILPNPQGPRPQGLPPLAEGFKLEELLQSTERAYLLEALRRTGGNKTEAAKLLGLSFRSFRHRLAKYGIK
jgi:two-component system response regulator PilR (NtrC family)